MCMTATQIGFMITAYYIGFAVGGVFYAIPDKYGRRISIIFGLSVALAGQTAQRGQKGAHNRPNGV